MEDGNPTILTALNMKRLIKAETDNWIKKKVPYAAYRIHTLGLKTQESYK